MSSITTCATSHPPSACASVAAMDSKVFRFDDRIWDTHHPPNGFNRRCMVKALTEEDFKEQKL